MEFEVFDNRDLMNVLSYCVMSFSKYLIVKHETHSFPECGFEGPK